MLQWGTERLRRSAAAGGTGGAGRGVQSCTRQAGPIPERGAEWAWGIRCHIRSKNFLTARVVRAKR